MPKTFSTQSPPIAMERGSEPYTYIMALRSMMQYVYALASMKELDLSKVTGGRLEVEVDGLDKKFVLSLELDE